MQHLLANGGARTGGDEHRRLGGDGLVIADTNELVVIAKGCLARRRHATGSGSHRTEA